MANAEHLKILKEGVEVWNDCKNLLEIDGASWRFRHLILQQWFAGRRVEPEENKPSK